jgi:exonuclease VII large subunit
MQYTLSQLTSLVKQTFDELFTEFDFWCTGEVARCDARGKYYFLELVEYDASGNSHAKCKATIFQSSVIESFLLQTKLHLDDLVKQEILFHGKCSFHPQY